MGEKLPVEQIQDYGPMAGSFGAGCIAAWGFLMRFVVPAELKALKVEIGLLIKKIDGLQVKADKYDGLLTELADKTLSELDN